MSGEKAGDKVKERLPGAIARLGELLEVYLSPQHSDMKRIRAAKQAISLAMSGLQLKEGLEFDADSIDMVNRKIMRKQLALRTLDKEVHPLYYQEILDLLEEPMSQVWGILVANETISDEEFTVLIPDIGGVGMRIPPPDERKQKKEFRNLGPVRI